MKRDLKKVLIVAVATLFLTLTISGVGLADTIKLGVAGPHSGDIAS